MLILVLQVEFLLLLAILLEWFVLLIYLIWFLSIICCCIAYHVSNMFVMLKIFNCFDSHFLSLRVFLLEETSVFLPSKKNKKTNKKRVKCSKAMGKNRTRHIAVLWQQLL